MCNEMTMASADHPYYNAMHVINNRYLIAMNRPYDTSLPAIHLIIDTLAPPPPPRSAPRPAAAAAAAGSSSSSSSQLQWRQMPTLPLKHRADISVVYNDRLYCWICPLIPSLHNRAITRRDIIMNNHRRGTGSGGDSDGIISVGNGYVWYPGDYTDITQLGHLPSFSRDTTGSIKSLPPLTSRRQRRKHELASTSILVPSSVESSSDKKDTHGSGSGSNGWQIIAPIELTTHIVDLIVNNNNGNSDQTSDSKRTTPTTTSGSSSISIIVC
jgi:hypothetical protein